MRRKALNVALYPWCISTDVRIEYFVVGMSVILPYIVLHSFDFFLHWCQQLDKVIENKQPVSI